MTAAPRSPSVPRRLRPRPSARRPPSPTARRSPRRRALILPRLLSDLRRRCSTPRPLAAAVLLCLPLAPDLRAQPLVWQVPLEPGRSTVVACRTSGPLTDLRVRDGDTVAPGDTLACLDATLPRLRLEAAAADLEVARHRAQAARTLYARQQLSRADLEPLEATLRAAVLRQAEAQADATATVLCAPFAGQVVDLSVHPGDYLTPGQPCCQLIDAVDLQARLCLTPERLALVHPGQSARAAPSPPPDAARLAALPPDPPLRGTVTYVAPQLDPQQGTATALVRFPGAGRRLRPGTLVTLTLAPH